MSSCRSWISLGIGAVAFWLAIAAGAHAQQFFSDSGTRRIYRSDFDGENLRVLFTAADTPSSIDVDEATGKVYWVQDRGVHIQRMNLDGTDGELLVDEFAEDVAADTAGGRIYWTAFPDSIRRAELDGTNIQTLLSGRAGPSNIELDVARGRMYWTEPDLGQILRASLDGSSVELVYEGGEPLNLKLFPSDGEPYWSDPRRGIFRSDLDGGAVVGVVTGIEPDGFTVDLNSRDVFWTSGGTVFRRSLSGGLIEQVLTGLSDPGGMDVDSATGLLYWGDRIRDKVQRATPDGEIVQDLTIGTPGGVQVDRRNGQVYWTEWRSIRRGSVNGGQIEDVVTDGFPGGFALNVREGVLYWTDYDLGRVFRRAIEGGPVLQLASGFREPTEVVLDDTRDKLFWLDPPEGRIHCLDLGGGGVNTLPIPELRFPSGLAIDKLEGRIYWGEASSLATNGVRSADLDGSNRRSVVDQSGPRGIAIDPNARKVYWTMSGGIFDEPAVRRANLDGTALEAIHADFLASPRGIDLEIDPLSCLAGTVDSSMNDVQDVLFLNGQVGGDERTVPVDSGDLIWASILAPPQGGPGRFVVHANLGLPNADTQSPLPDGIGIGCFEFLFTRGSSPAAVWDNTGKARLVGSSRYFDGSAIRDPERAPTTFLQLFDGDDVHLPPGTTVTFQGILFDPGSASARGASVTNAVMLGVR